MKHSSIIYPRPTLVDNDGVTYRLEFFSIDECWTFKVFQGARPVGYSYCWKLGHQLGLRINDIRIREDVPVRMHPLRATFRRLMNLRLPVADYRRRGIGTALLHAILESAQENGFNRVTGEIKKHDLARFPGLPDWYAREGFTIERNGGRILIEQALSAKS